MIKIYLDENISPYLARGLKTLHTPLMTQEPIDVISLPDVYGRGVKDEDWIPKLGAEGSVVITQDLNIHHTRSQRELYQQHGLGVIFFKPPSNKGYPYWEMVQQMVKRWDEIKRIVQREKRPFAYRYTNRSVKAEPML